MYESIYSLQIKANRGSKSALEEINKRKNSLCNIKLTGIHNEKIVFALSDEINEKIYYINNNILKIDTNKSIMKKQVLLDSYSSATIEGARTTVENVVKAISNQSNNIDKSTQMVINTVKACNIAYKNEINLDNIRDIWEVITYKVCENEHLKGIKFRNGMVYIGSNTRTIHTPCDVEHINEKMTELFSWLNTEYNINELIKSCILHFYTVYIHPFCDGNGRTTRLMQSSYLIHHGYSNIKYVSISESINNDLNMYYKTLQESEYTYNNMLDITPFISYILDKICDSIDNTISKYNKLSDIQLKILRKMEKGSEITVNKACKITKATPNITRTTLNKLVDLGYLVKRKDGKINIYRLK